MSDAGVAVRRSAARAVAAVVTGGESLSAALPGCLAPLSGRDRGLAQELAYGTVRWWLRLDAWLNHLLDHRPANHFITALLAVGLYQLAFTRVPPHAAVSTTVAAAPRALRGLVNGVLRGAQRRLAELEALAGSDPVAASAHPRWLLDALAQDWPDDRQSIVAAGNQPAPMSLRVNRLRTTRAAYLDELAAAGIAARPSASAADGLTLASAMPVATLPGFADGRVSVQDCAAQLAADVVDAGAGMRVLDACAAPGGKACHLLERTPGLAALVAVEIDAARLPRIDENLTRLGLAAQVVHGDAARPGDWWDGRPFERVLLDAPCSATGVIRRHPDIRLLRRADDVAALAARQRALLDALWPLVADDGMLVYATCSVLAAENDAVIGAFAHGRGGARLEAIDGGWGRATACGRQILPGEDGMDGFYYACLHRVPDPAS